MKKHNYILQLELLWGRYNNPNATDQLKNILAKTINSVANRCTEAGVELPDYITNFLNIAADVEFLHRELTSNTQVEEVSTQPSCEGTEPNIPVNPQAAPNTLDYYLTGNFPYNARQRQAMQYALDGKSFVLTGPAGSGKTTTVKGVVNVLLASHALKPIGFCDHKVLRSGRPGIAFVSFTNKAVNNLKKFLPEELRGNCMTIHKLLEFEPSEEEYTKEDGESDTRFAFKETRNANRPLPDLDYLVIDEGTMVNVPMFNLLMDALPNPNLKLIIIGDINQLPPVFGKSIFIHAMQKGVRVVELNEVHRQALESPILALAHRILSGKPIAAPELPSWTIDKSKEGYGKLTIRTWKQRRSANVMMASVGPFFEMLINNKDFDPEQDTVICPFGKSYGTEIMNEAIATVHSKNLKAPVFEIFAGIDKRYFRIGERVLHDKTEHIIKSISTNPAYFGRSPRPASDTMNYSGQETDPTKLLSQSELELTEADLADAEARIKEMMNALRSHVDEDNPRRRASSHVIVLTNLDTNEEVTLTSAGDVGDLLLGYAVTVHRTQGSEYRKVIIMLHHTHAVLLSRELTYVAVTRAKEELMIYCEPNSFVTGIVSQKIKGKTVEEKILSFEAEYSRGLKNKSVPLSEIPQGLDRFIESQPTN